MNENSDSNSKPTSYGKLLWTLGLLALFLSVFTVSLVHYYGGNRPTIGDEANGRTHSVKIHSKTVYLTGGEMGLVLTTHALAILDIGAFLGVLLKSRRPRKPPNSGQPKAA